MDRLLAGIRGCVYGQALGDAFCMPALLTPGQTRARFGRITQLIAAPDDHPVHAGLPAGRITDDTEQAMWLARQIIADGKVTLEGSAHAILGWYNAIDGDNCIFVGPSTRRAVSKIKSGRCDLHKTGLGGDTNGSAMRASVVGLIHPGDAEGAARDAVLSSIPTHNTSVACAAAAAIAGGVACAVGASDFPAASLRGPSAVAPTLRDVIEASIEAAKIGESLGVTSLGASVARRIDFAVSLARDETGSDSDRLQAIFDLVGTSLVASEAVSAAMGVVALADGDPVRAAMLAAELSGDADTIGAMACAVCGAWKGVDAIPAEMRETLRAANPEYDFDAVAEGLFTLAMKPTTWRNL